MSSTTTACFIMPHWTMNIDTSQSHLDEAIESIYRQTDGDWSLVIVDDASPCRHARSYLLEIERRSRGQVHLLFNDKNLGHGLTRNAAIRHAHSLGAPFLLFNDADDLSHPRRLEVVRRLFADRPEADVVYSTFRVIDEFGEEVAVERLTESIREILEGHSRNPAEGANAWIGMGLEKGYTNLTSSTAVRTKLALEYPFPNEEVSEDYYTWLCYSAGGTGFIYHPDIPSSYRIPQNTGSASRARIERYYELKAEADERGFLRALEIAEARNKIDLSPRTRAELLSRFYERSSETMRRENQLELADRQLAKAASVREAASL